MKCAPKILISNIILYNKVGGERIKKDITTKKQTCYNIDKTYTLSHIYDQSQRIRFNGEKIIQVIFKWNQKCFSCCELRECVCTSAILIVFVKWHRIEPHKDKTTEDIVLRSL